MIRVINICGIFVEKFLFDLRNFDNNRNARIFSFFFFIEIFVEEFLLGGGNIGGRRKLDFCLALLN